MSLFTIFAYISSANGLFPRLQRLLALIPVVSKNGYIDINIRFFKPIPFIISFTM
jgi:hypothetical protein